VARSPVGQDLADLFDVHDGREGSVPCHASTRTHSQESEPSKQHWKTGAGCAEREGGNEKNVDKQTFLDGMLIRRRIVLGSSLAAMSVGRLGMIWHVGSAWQRETEKNGDKI
jgi:hypothetical protein